MSIWLSCNSAFFYTWVRGMFSWFLFCKVKSWFKQWARNNVMNTVSKTSVDSLFVHMQIHELMIQNQLMWYTSQSFIVFLQSTCAYERQALYTLVHGSSYRYFHANKWACFSVSHLSHFSWMSVITHHMWMSVRIYCCEQHVSYKANISGTPSCSPVSP